MANRPHQQQPPQKDRRDANEQSGSTGRNTGTGDKRDGANTGQDNYGMTGGADRNPPQPGHDTGSSGTSEYGRSDLDSNEGSGRADRDESEHPEQNKQKPTQTQTQRK